jgi:hypothetical protein
VSFFLLGLCGLLFFPLGFIEVASTIA